MPNTEIYTNFESVGELVGAYMGMSEKASEPEYIERIIKQAHGKAASAFDIATAATAGAGYLAHVYEFGVAGITRGQPRFFDATDPAARLYYHEITGDGGNQEIGWGWRPATQPNPQPTTADTGVASKYLRKLSRRKYIFWNKAFVMESGETVEIKAYNSNYLFVPFGQYASKNPENKRGFVMFNTTNKGPITSKPGASTKDTFTAHWLNWWGQAGAEIMESDMTASVTTDIEIAEAEIAKRAAASPMKPVRATNITSASASSRTWMKRLFGAKRKIRKVR